MGYGKNLKGALNAHGMNVKELSRRTGISATTLYSVIRRDSSVRYDHALRIINVLDIEIDFICKDNPNSLYKGERIKGICCELPLEASFSHSLVNGNIYAQIKAGMKNSRCLVFIENLKYKYSKESDDYFIPDIMVIGDKNLIIGGAYTGVPIFLVETLSPATVWCDRKLKKEIYASCGVEEYWIVSSRERAIEIYYLVDGKYVLNNAYILELDKKNRYYNAEELITLKGIPIKMKLEDIFEGLE